VFRFVYSRVGNTPDAEDITAVTFERALPRLQSNASDRAVHAYLLACARSQIAEHWRSRHRVEVLDDDVSGPEVAVEHEDAQGAQVTEMLRQLPDSYRRVLELRFLRGYSLKEAAQEMETTVGNVKVLQLRALRRAAEEKR
jgi:RNA polymerase sigma-70 factor, ECF subfamily